MQLYHISGCRYNIKDDNQIMEEKKKKAKGWDGYGPLQVIRI